MEKTWQTQTCQNGTNFCHLWFTKKKQDADVYPTSQNILTYCIIPPYIIKQAGGSSRCNNKEFCKKNISSICSIECILEDTLCTL